MVRPQTTQWLEEETNLETPAGSNRHEMGTDGASAQHRLVLARILIIVQLTTSVLSDPVQNTQLAGRGNPPRHPRKHELPRDPRRRHVRTGTRSTGGSFRRRHPSSSLTCRRDPWKTRPQHASVMVSVMCAISDIVRKSRKTQQTKNGNGRYCSRQLRGLASQIVLGPKVTPLR